MKPTEIEQIKTIITNFEEQKKYIPFLSDLEAHESLGPIFKALHAEDKEDVKKIINEYVVEKITSYKTKGGQLFRRFFEAQEELFWKFRDLNQENKKNSQQKQFQETGKIVEDELFRYEGILTERMLDQEKGLDKVIGSFYNIVYTFFPNFGKLE